MVSALKIAHRSKAHHLLRDRNKKCRTLSILALHTNLTMHQVNQPLCDGKTQTTALNRRILLDIKAHKALEQTLLILLAYAHARILHRHFQHKFFIIHPFPVSCQGNAALLGIFHRICYQICNYLADTHIIPHQRGRKTLINTDHNLKILLFRLRFKQMYFIIKQAGKLIRFLHNLNLAGLNL